MFKVMGKTSEAKVYIFNVMGQKSEHWNNSPRIDMWPHVDTLFWFWANQSLLLLHNAACLAEKQQVPIL
jgi:hypothetical protein